MYKGIEGIRAWLAWTVVGSHLFLHSGLYSRFPVNWVAQAGDHAVKMFIIISGFVIAHLILVKNEPYGLYIARRALRLYPAYLLCLAAGVLIYAYLLGPITDIGLPHSRQQMHFVHQLAGFRSDFWPNLAAHLTLLHGMIPNTVLDEAQYMFDPPAWSLSLEWQYYLIAPFVIAALAGTPRQRIITVAAIALAYWVYVTRLSHIFYNPSLILGVGPFFLLGIATRFTIERLPTFERYPWAIVIGLLPIAMLTGEAALVGWPALVLYLRTKERTPLFDSALATRMGDRSYSVYISHVPIILVCYSLFGRLAFWPKAAAIVLCTVVATLIVTELLYRFVESPAIRWGKQLGRGTPAPDAVAA